MPEIAGLFTFQYGVQNKNTPLVLLHGAGGLYLSWPPQVRRLPGHPVYALDLPAHGKSAGAVLTSIEALAQAVISWMDALQLPPLVIAGHSMGSAVAMQIAHTAGSRLRGLVLLGSAPRLAVNPALLQLAEHSATLPQAVEKIVRWSFGPDTPGELTAQVQQRMLAMHPGVLHADFSACNDFDFTSRLAALNLPVLLLSGALDKMTPLPQAQAMQQMLPNARLQVFENAGHMLMLERPAETAQALSAFLNDL